MRSPGRQLVGGARGDSGGHPGRGSLALLSFAVGSLLASAASIAPVAPATPAALAAPASPAASLAPAGTVAFGQPTAEGALGQPIRFRTELRSDAAPARVELLIQIPDQRARSVRVARLTDLGEGRFRAETGEAEHVPPNTTYRYRFRAVLPDGSRHEGPAAAITVADDRFDWRSRSHGPVTLHWYEGDDAFADRALDIGARAIERASQLLGVEQLPAVDFFVYADRDAFYEALGPGTRENVGGQANADIRTMFGLLRPGDVGSDWVDTLVTHELTHLVFAEAVRNPYHFPPRWLNEGLAVHLSEGYGDADRALVRRAVRDGSLIPLVGLSGLFPTSRDGFSLAYAESASAVDHLILTFGEDRLAALIWSYAGGVTDDEAFGAAIGMGMAEFDAAWMASLGATPPEPHGPRPGPPGPVPEAWASPAP